MKLKGDAVNVYNFPKKLEAAVKDETEVRMPQTTTTILLMDIDDCGTGRYCKSNPTLQDVM